jgi:hypothetical protein
MLSFWRKEGFHITGAGLIMASDIGLQEKRQETARIPVICRPSPLDRASFQTGVKGGARQSDRVLNYLDPPGLGWTDSVAINLQVFYFKMVT